MKITVIGLGYVGLSIAILLGQYNEVYGCDIDKKKVKMLKDKTSPIDDSDISEFLSSHKLDIVWDANASSHYDVDYIVIAVPTNYDEEMQYFDTSIVESIISDIVYHKSQATIVVKSTVPIGFTSSMIDRYGYESIMFCPEFLREGKALHDNLFPSRIVVGSNECMIPKAEEFSSLLAGGAMKGNIDVYHIGVYEAEAVKLFANTYLALRISYFNEIDSYCIKNSLNAKEVIEAISSDSRIGDYYNNPSFGYGGYCLPKDTKQLLSNFKDISQSTISASVEANKIRKQTIANDIYDTWLSLDTDKPICIYRLTMKSGSDNFREAAISEIIDELDRHCVPMVIYEPMIKGTSYRELKVKKSLSKVEKECSMVVANRMTSELKGIDIPIYTRDIYNRD